MAAVSRDVCLWASRRTTGVYPEKGSAVNVACIVIAGTGKRRELIDQTILPSVLPQGFSETLIVGEHHDGRGYRYLHVPTMLGTTVDALVKRDVGALATRADLLLFLSDDHALDNDFLAILTGYAYQYWDALVPHRYTVRNGQRIHLSNGQSEKYCGGHGGVFRREVVERFPWTTGSHDRCWDRIISYQHQERGFQYAFAGEDLAIIDSEPGASPWL